MFTLREIRYVDILDPDTQEPLHPSCNVNANVCNAENHKLKYYYFYTHIVTNIRKIG